MLTGSATALTGAPGSVLLYGLIGLMAWPRTTGRHATATATADPGEVTGVASSAAARGLGGAVTPLAVWSGFWSLAAILFVLPDNRTQTSDLECDHGHGSRQSALVQPLPHDHRQPLRLGRDPDGLGLAVISLIIGFGPLVARRPGVFLAAGGVLSALFWITGQGLVGGDLHWATGRIPTRRRSSSSWRWPWSRSSAPTRAVPPPRSWRCCVGIPSSPSVGGPRWPWPWCSARRIRRRPRRRPAWRCRGMTGMSGDTPSSDTATTASCTAGNSGTARSGLDLTNTPYMIMGGTAGMNMNGADASAAAGLNTTKANWDYTGPALPSALAQELLADGKNGPDEIHMAATGCAPEPTFSQQINASQYVQATSQAVAQYADPAAAVAAGYMAVSPTDYPVVYYVNPAIEAANAAAKRTLSPAHVDGLVYAQIPSGQQVLAAAMYVLPATVAKAPMPFGALVQWHQRTAVCGPLTGSATTLNITGTPPCAAGTVQKPTPYLTMVWQVPVAGGPTAIQPPDIQIVEAAIMQAAT